MAAGDITIIAHPRYDAIFSAVAEANTRGGADTPQELERRLKERYERARVVSGISGRGAQRWYAYRDGHWVDEAY